MSDWQGKENERIKKLGAERAAVLALKDVLVSACVDANRRPGTKNSFNLPADVNALVLSVYQQFREKVATGGRSSWAGMGVSTRELIGFDICHYGKDAERFYVTPVSKEEHEQQSQAAYAAIEKQLNEEAL